MSRRATRLIFLSGTLALWLFFVVAHARVLATPAYDPFGTERFVWSVVFISSFIVGAYATGLPDLPRTRLLAAGSALISAVVALGVVSMAQLLFGRPLLPRATVGGLMLTLTPWSIVAWHLSRDGSARLADRILVVGRDEERGAIEADLVGEVERPAELVGHMSTLDAIRQVDGSAPLVALARERGADVIVLDSASQAETTIVAQAAQLHAEGMRVRTVSLFTEEYFGKISVSELQRVSLLFDIGELHRMRYVRAKRIVDVLIGLVGVAVLVAILPIVFVGNRIGNKGPLFYGQPRVAKGGDIFQIHKFRSMSSGTTDTSWTAEDDARITPFGNVLRRTHLDELPQVWNILRGDISVVGPRPEQPHYVEELEKKIPYFGIRHLVRPGLTGWAQVKYSYAASDSDAREKLQYDLYYLRRQSTVLDVRIVVRTLRTIFLGGGR